MQVDRIGYEPNTGQYLVFPTDPSDLHNIRDWLRVNLPGGISPYFRDTNFGGSVSFGVLTKDIATTIPQIVRRLRPTLPATAQLLRLEYLRESCKEHYVLNIGFSMAPGLPLHRGEDELQVELDAFLQEAGIPKDLPLEGGTPVAVMASIRRACSKVGIYAQGVRVESRTDLSNACVTCSKG